MTIPASEARWWKAKASNNNGGCVEVGDLGDRVGIRDTKNRSGGHLTVTRASFRAFVADAKAGNLLPRN